MVTQPINARGIEFNIQYRNPILNLVITEVQNQTHWIYQKNRVMRQRFECL